MVRLSPRVFLYPSDAPPPSLPEGALGLPQLASKAFGDGSHATTRLCAGAVDLLCRQRRPGAVLDVGTGTGVLARIARARGAALVVATDIDPVALAAARQSAALDRHAVDIVVENRPPDSRGPSFELVVANILEGALVELAAPLGRALAPGGVLLVSGFTPPQVPALRATFTRQGLTAAGEALLDGWVMLMFQDPRAA